MKKILNNPSYENKQGYNGLNMGSVLNFSSTVGHVCPLTWDFLQPGDKVSLKTHLRTRTQPLLSPAFAEIEENVHWFFVPISQVYKPFEQLYNGIQDYNQDFFSTIITTPSRLSDLLPVMTISDLLNFMENLVQDNTSASIMKFFNAMRLMEYLGLPVTEIFNEYNTGGQVTTYKNHSINLLPFLAYHKIWFDYFRDSDRVANNPRYYNCDSWCDSNTRSGDITSRLSLILELHRCLVQKDTVNNVFVSPLFGETGVGGDNKNILRQVNNWLTASTVNTASGQNVENARPLTTYPVNSNAGLAASVASLRSIFAVEKLLEVTRRANKHYDSQVLAHFGVDVPMGINGECIEICKHTTNLVIGDVVSTAGTDDNALGSLAGKGYASEISDIGKFEAKTHGILMCVYYARPIYNYRQTGFDKKVVYSKVSDFPRPEFENLGMQPVFALNTALNSDQDVNSMVLAWQYRYNEVKTQYNRSIGGLVRSLKNWNIIKAMTYGSAENFYVKSTDLNTIMDTKFKDDSWFSNHEDAEDVYQMIQMEMDYMYNNDPLISQIKFDYLKSSKISTYGLAKL